jgi:hypothetical protein
MAGPRLDLPRISATVGAYANVVNAFLIGAIAVYAFARASVSSAVIVRDLLWFTVACGLASFATIEAVKRLTGIRALYHERETKRWIERRAVRRNGEEPDPFWMLLSVMGVSDDRSPGDRKRVFDLPAEQLAAQLSGAAEIAVATPDAYGPLVAAFAAGYGPTSRGGAYELAQRVRAGVDQLQISLSERWRRYVQGAALWLAGLYGILLTRVVDVARDAEATYILAALVVGGPLAWLIRDATAAVERLRR